MIDRKYFSLANEYWLNKPRIVSRSVRLISDLKESNYTVSWLPDPPIVLVLLERIKAGESLLHDSSELFWYFCMNSMGPEKFKERTEFWIDRQLEDSPKGGGFIDPEIRDNILQGPEKLAQTIIDKLDKLSDKKFVPYHPDEKDDPIALYIYLHIEASRLTRFIKSERYSERTREVLGNAISALNRCNKAIDYLNAPWSQEYSVSLIAVGSFLYITQFWLRKSDGDYEEALKSLFWGFAQNMMASLSFPKNGFPNPNAIALISFINGISNFWQHTPWMQDLDPQDIVDCFEAIRTRSDSKDFKEVANICSYFVTVAKNWWPNDEQEIEVKDANGELWSLPEYWQHALGWVEAQLQPSELRDLLNEREEQAAEQRLRTYFFSEILWAKLPERARRSIISADRDWFSGSITRTEAVLNELQIATLELLINGLWNPMEEWIKRSNGKQVDANQFYELQADLNKNNRSLTMLDLERTCRMPATVAFLASRGLAKEEQTWINKVLPGRLFQLRRFRNRAEHESTHSWTQEILGNFINEFIGIAQPGILPRLGKLLFSKTT